MCKNKKKRLIREFCIGLLIILFLAVACIVLIHFTTEEIRSETNDSVSNIKEEEFEKIWIHIQDTQKEANDYLSGISENIQSDILEKCDMDVLSEHMENNIPDVQLNDILKDNVQSKYFSKLKNDDNGIYVCSRYGILADFSHKTSSLRDNENSTWEEELSYQYNKDLAKNSVNKILTQDTSDIIVVEPEENTKVKDHEYLSYLDKDNLKSVYMKEGIEGLKNYQVLVPVYITSNGDIFGKSDIDSGVLIDNNKIILIQKFNIYQQLINRDPTVLESGVDNILDKSDNTIMLLQILGLFFAVSFVIVILYTSSIFNNFILDELDKK